jgi:hypothetical protein
MNRLLLSIAASLPFLLACGQSGQNGQSAPASQHTALSGDLSKLRSQFNADTGKVRAIFLAAPT